jgi:hypothetical protein
MRTATISCHYRRCSVRFRQSHNRLQLSLVKTRRLAGEVVHEHVASLGSIITPSSVADRVTFWQRLRERLARLANRIDVEAQGAGSVPNSFRAGFAL